MKNHSKIILSLLLVCSFKTAAEDSLSAVMARMKPDTAVRIRYRETRYMDLLAEPWEGAGYFYARPPDLMLKEQFHPSREIMGASGSRIYYYDPANNVRHQGVIEQDDPVSLNLSAFKALVNGDKALLKALYKIEFCSKPEQWILTLKAKDPTVDESLDKIVISGLSDQPANKIEVIQLDGDRTLFSIKKDGQGKEIEAAVAQINGELQRD